MRRAVLAALAVVAAVAVLVGPAATPASAHDELLSSTPADGQTVAAMPRTVRFTFAEETGPDDLTVKAGGSRLPVSAVAGTAHVLAVDVSDLDAAPTVTLRWQVVDEHDGHVTSGSLAFHVRGAASAPSSAPSPSPTPSAVASPTQGDLVSSIPAAGYSVTTLPAVARLTFSRATPASAVAVTAAGKPLPVRAVPGQPSTVTVDLAKVRPTETVTLSWTVRRGPARVSHGVLAFHVLEHVAATASSTSRDRPLHTLSVVLHVIGYLAMAVLLGGLFFVTALWPAGAEERRTRILLGGAAATGFAAALAGVRVAVRQVSPLPVREALAQHFGRVAVAESLMWLLTGVVVVAVLQHPGVVRTAAWRVGAVAVAVGLIRTTGMSAHGTQGKDATTGIVVDFLHLAGVSAWVGGLTVLTVVLLPRRRLPEIAAVVPRFSAIAASSAILVLMSGLVLAWQLVGSLHALFSTHYGHVLVVKLVLVGLLLLTALVSKRWVELRLERAVAAGGIDAVRSFAVSVGVEAALVLGVLGAASVLVTSSPGM